MRFRGKMTVLGLVLGFGITACADDLFPSTGGMPTSPVTTEGSTGSVTTSQGSTTSTGDASSTAEPPTGTATAGKPDLGSGGGMCNVWTQDCPEGLKCTAYGPPNSYIPTGIKCVPEPENPKAHNEPCSQFGEGLGDDDCALGSVCLDLDYDGTGFCLPYCTGDKDNPMCEDDRTCVKLFFGYEFGNCFAKCDPLIQNCAPDEGCYMDAIMVGNTGFVCLPVVQEGHGKTYNAPCFGWSSCEPGYACVYDTFLPDCDGNGLCCSPWCDITEVDPCVKFDPALECIPWFNKQPPPGYENVGICGIPQ